MADFNVAWERTPRLLKQADCHKGQYFDRKFSVQIYISKTIRVHHSPYPVALIRVRDRRCPPRGVSFFCVTNKTQRPPRGGLSEFRSGVLIRRR